MFIWLFYVLALVGRFDLGLFTHLTGVMGILFLLSNVYWHFIRKH